MTEKGHRYKLYLDSLPEDNPEAEALAVSLLQETGLSEDEAEIALQVLPFCIMDSLDPAPLNQQRKKFAQAGFEVSLEVEEEDDDEFEIEIDLSSGRQEYQRKGSQVYTISDDGEDLERLHEPEESVDANEIAALLADIESSIMVQKPETPSPEELIKKQILSDHKKTVKKLLKDEGIEETVDGPPATDLDEEILEEADPNITDTPVSPPTAGDADKTEISASDKETIPKQETPEKRKLRATRKKQFQFIGACLAGGVILILVGLGVSQYVQSNQEPEVSFEEALLKLAREEAKKESETKEVLVDAPPDFTNGIYTGSLNNEHFSASIRTLVENSIVTDISFSLNTTEPPPLTDIEIVQGKQRAPWLHTIRLSHMNITENSPESFLITSIAKAYVDYADQRARLNADSVITITLFLENGEMKGRVLINKGYKEVPDTNFLLEKLEGSQEFQFFLQSEFTLSFNEAETNDLRKEASSDKDD